MAHDLKPDDHLVTTSARQPRGMPIAGRILIWFGSVIGFGFAALSVLSVAYVEFLDCSNPELRGSGNTAGWVIVVAALVVPVVVALRLTSLRHWLPWLALGVAASELWTWAWLLDPAGCSRP